MLRKSLISCSFSTPIRSFLFCIFAGLVILQSGCSALFFDDFKADAVGGTPNISPPSPPVGDMISYSTVEALKIIDSPVLNSRSLQISALNVAIPITFWAIDRPNGDRPLYVHWIGYLPDRGAPATTFAFHAGHYASALFITFKGGNIYDAFNTELAGRTPIGTYTPGTRHGVMITIDTRQHTYDLNISEPGVTKVDLRGRPIKNNVFFEQLSLTNRVALSVFPQELEGVTIPRPAYVIDDVQISQRRPEPLRVR